MKTSIRRRLLLRLLPVLLITSLAFAVPAWLNVHEEIDELFDNVLRETAYSVLNSSVPPDGQTPGRALPVPADNLDLVSQVWQADGRLLYRSHAFSPLPYGTEDGWSTVNWRGEPWRVYSLKIAGQVVQVAQKIAERRDTADEIGLHLLAPLFVLLPGLALLVGLGIGRGLRPVRDVAVAVERRAPHALEPIPDSDLPQEVAILVTALNGLLRRLDDALAAQRRFTADAAHELRSPLTAVSLQAQVAERATEPEQRAAALQSLRRGIARAHHLVQQLLTLARLDPDAARHAPAPLRLDGLARRVVGECAPLAENRGIDLGIVGSEPVVVSGDDEALRILLGNLLDNAVRYTPAGGHVDVSVAADGDGARLRVSDSGPGIPPKERERVFDRFYRVLGQDEPGSGLGLAIVKRIADGHGATVSLGDGDAGQGLRVCITFPKESA